MLKTGVELISLERVRQLEQKGYTNVHDSQYGRGALTNAAICYTTMAGSGDAIRKQIRDQNASPFGWPWEQQYWKPGVDDCSSSRIRELTIAGALIAAEIDRLQREGN